jgi:hypothetical protein
MRERLGDDLHVHVGAGDDGDADGDDEIKEEEEEDVASADGESDEEEEEEEEEEKEEEGSGDVVDDDAVEEVSSTSPVWSTSLRSEACGETPNACTMRRAMRF